jgi:hypothetical protein
MSISMHKAFLKATQKEGTRVYNRIRFIEKRLAEIIVTKNDPPSEFANIPESVILKVELDSLRAEAKILIDTMISAKMKIQELDNTHWV